MFLFKITHKLGLLNFLIVFSFYKIWCLNRRSKLFWSCRTDFWPIQIINWSQNKRKKFVAFPIINCMGCVIEFTWSNKIGRDKVQYPNITDHYIHRNFQFFTISMWYWHLICSILLGWNIVLCIVEAIRYSWYLYFIGQIYCNMNHWSYIYWILLSWYIVLYNILYLIVWNIEICINEATFTVFYWVVYFIMYFSSWYIVLCIIQAISTVFFTGLVYCIIYY